MDIYRYPEEFEKHLDSTTIGDLHGNAAKLVYFLLRHNVLKFKEEIKNPVEAYQELIDLYEENFQLTSAYTIAKAEIDQTKKYLDSLQEKLEKYKKLAAIQEQERTEQEKGEFSQFDEERLARLVKLVDESQSTIKKQEQILNEVSENLVALVDKFNNFMSKLAVMDNSTLIRLIGDELADRGSNDYFTLRLLDFLRENHVNVNILISNHSNEFITAYENWVNKKEFKPADLVEDKQKPSLVGLKLLLDKGIVTQEEVSTLVEKSYKPTLKALDYSLSDEGITLFSHAPVRFDAIRHVANRLGVVYNDSSKEALAATIDKINTKFAKYVETNTIGELCNVAGINLKDIPAEKIAAAPLVYLIWNRWTDNKDTEEARPATVNGYPVRYVHGHDPYQSKFTQVINLDTPCGQKTPLEQQKTINEARKELERIEQEELPNTRKELETATTEKEQENIKLRLKGVESQKDKLEKLISKLGVYKVLNSDERGLNQKHDPALIDKEYQQANSISAITRAGIFGGAFGGTALLIGAGIGVTLVATGVFAPFGAAILGVVALAAVFGGGLAALAVPLGIGIAKKTEPEPVNTMIADDSKFKEEPIRESPSAFLGLGGRVDDFSTRPTNQPKPKEENVSFEIEEDLSNKNEGPSSSYNG